MSGARLLRACTWEDARRLAGYEGHEEIPGWVSAVWLGYSVFETERVLKAIDAAGSEFREQLEAASRLGGDRAVETLVDALLAQDEDPCSSQKP